MRGLGEFLHRVNGAQAVGDVDEADQFNPPIEQLMEGFQVQRAVLVHGADHQFTARGLGAKLPGDDIGVMLHGRDEHAVTGLQLAAAPTVGDEVDAVGAAHGVNDFVALRAEETGDDLTGLFVKLG